MMPQWASHDLLHRWLQGLALSIEYATALYTIAQYYLCLYNSKPHISHQGVKGLCGARQTVLLVAYSE
jgi:hypothetical protein